MLVLWFGNVLGELLRKQSFQSLDMLAGNMKEVLGYQRVVRSFSGMYANVLKSLVRLQDNLGPYTIGYSELMSRYSIVIAGELGLAEEEIRDIAMAAYLSNIGVLGISTDLTNKEGKLSDEEFELMKLHSEVGASIVRSTLGNERVATLILHHHERIDGFGYPAGLPGEDIPLGSRIVAVVQTFLAMVGGRKYREPYPFDQVLGKMREAAGTQLDERVVDVFLAWFKRKQADPQIAGRSLGVCWEMCCTPSSICNNCPAYKRTDVNCWEVGDNNCQAHGKECRTCYVRTEYVTRKEGEESLRR
jgi:HD-GYP domain-containing protein (c-di-GMP phosphodiesterase class II)